MVKAYRLLLQLSPQEWVSVLGRPGTSRVSETLVDKSRLRR